MLDKIMQRLQRDRRLAVFALILSTVFFGLGSFATQTAIDAKEGVFAILGIALLAVGLIGQLLALAALFRSR
ncbi:hypothetical protein [Crenobacter cavernae]|uniref:DUF2970 domain-containing protein n=1 Tax=Crenobacter cavernae TaxID=2290923 RepID=A0ABY0FDE1_9NEIS|nr:hypothetical protein [Crenobacter cavernae]RXZ44204.1 hypothetical protein EBB06_06610 [Crenobacter cavernae]